MPRDNLPVVCDIGSGCIKAGFAGDLYPSVRAPCVGHSLKDDETGKADATTEPLSSPIVNGMIQNWEVMERLLSDTFVQALQIQPHENQILVTDPPLNPKLNQQLMMELMLETFNFSAISLQSQPVLSLYSQGLMSGIVVDSGAAVTHIVPVLDGVADHCHSYRLPLAGDHVNDRLRHLLAERGYTLPSGRASGIARMKERCCYAAVDYVREVKLARETTCLAMTYSLPDGQSVRLGQERFQAPEVLFRPHVMGYETLGISEAVHAAIHGLPIDLRLGMYQKVLLAGGTMMLPGMSTRIEEDLRSLYCEHILKGQRQLLSRLKLRVEDPPLRRHMVYTGASILAEVMADFPQSWVTQADYQEDPMRALMKNGAVFQGAI